MLGTAVLSPACRLKLAFQLSPGYQHGCWYGRQHGAYVLPAYSNGCARARDGNHLLRACAIPEYAAGALGMTKMPLVRVARLPNEVNVLSYLYSPVLLCLHFHSHPWLFSPVLLSGNRIDDLRRKSSNRFPEL